MSEDQEPFGGTAADDAAAALKRVQQEVAALREMLRLWKSLSSDKRQSVLALMRAMNPDGAP